MLIPRIQAGWSTRPLKTKMPGFDWIEAGQFFFEVSDLTLNLRFVELLTGVLVERVILRAATLETTERQGASRR
jgi:hypothetical protein